MRGRQAGVLGTGVLGTSAIRYTDTLAGVGALPSVRSVGDSYGSSFPTR